MRISAPQLYKIFLLTILILFPNNIWASEDWQYWSEYSISYKLNSRLSIVVNPTLRMKDDMSENQYWESSQGLSYKATDHLTVNLHYIHSESKNSTNKWIDENAAELQPTYKWSWAGMDFSNRLRILLRNVNGIEKRLYRDQLKVSKKTKWWGCEVSPFISDEIFYDESADQMNQNRLRIGVSKKLTKQMTVSSFYQYKTNAIKQDWSGENVLGTGIDLSF